MSVRLWPPLPDLTIGYFDARRSTGVWWILRAEPRGGVTFFETAVLQRSLKDIGHYPITLGNPRRSPYERVGDAEHVSDEARDCLKTVHQSLNRFILENNFERTGSC